MFNRNSVPKEWKPEPTFKFKWKNPLHLMAGALFLSSMITGAQAEVPSTQFTKVYQIYCFDEEQSGAHIIALTRDKAIKDIANFERGRNRDTAACSIAEISVTPVSDEELSTIKYRP